MQLKIPVALTELGFHHAEFRHGESEQRWEGKLKAATIKPEVIPEGNALAAPKFAFGSFHNLLAS